MSISRLTDAFQDQFDVAFIFSADSDLVGPIRVVRRLFSVKRIIVIFPPGHSSYALKQAANGFLHIGRVELSKSLFPEKVLKEGVIIRRPSRWR